jgi:hypothetical protein
MRGRSWDIRCIEQEVISYRIGQFDSLLRVSTAKKGIVGWNEHWRKSPQTKGVEV